MPTVIFLSKVEIKFINYVVSYISNFRVLLQSTATVQLSVTLHSQAVYSRVCY